MVIGWLVPAGMVVVLGWFYWDRWRFEQKKQRMIQSIQSKFFAYIQSLENMDEVLHDIYTATPDSDPPPTEV